MCDQRVVQAAAAIIAAVAMTVLGALDGCVTGPPVESLIGPLPCAFDCVVCGTVVPPWPLFDCVVPCDIVVPSCPFGCIVVVSSIAVVPGSAVVGSAVAGGDMVVISVSHALKLWQPNSPQLDEQHAVPGSLAGSQKPRTLVQPSAVNSSEPL